VPSVLAFDPPTLLNWSVNYMWAQSPQQEWQCSSGYYTSCLIHNRPRDLTAPPPCMPSCLSPPPPCPAVVHPLPAPLHLPCLQRYNFDKHALLLTLVQLTGQLAQHSAFPEVSLKQNMSVWRVRTSSVEGVLGPRYVTGTVAQHSAFPRV
jgi:hypothetical protein